MRWWKDEDDKLAASEDLIERGIITIEERPGLDLALVRIPDDLTSQRVHRFTQPRLTECHPFALHNRTGCSRLLVLHGHRAELQYRYEGWVQMASRRPALRVDLSPLADELTLAETAGGRWVFDGVEQITPKLHLGRERRDVDSAGHHRAPRRTSSAKRSSGLESLQ